MKFMNQKIIGEYESRKEEFCRLEDYVVQKIRDILKADHIMIMALEHRVKTLDSLTGKLEKKDGKYHKLGDITDILGIRIICYFADDVDVISALISKSFRVDWDNSVDKRAKLNPTVFGYLSVHYICQLFEQIPGQEKLSEIKFEIQIRSTLQHVWAEIEHDLGYKSEFAIPQKIRRDFSRVAGLLEIADEKFVSIRDGLDNYSEEVRRMICDDEVAEIMIDLISLTEYVRHNKRMRHFLNEIAKIGNAEISDISPEAYLKQLSWLGKVTLGDVSAMLDRNFERAIGLAQKALEDTDIDIISSNVGLRYLCQAELLEKQYTEEQIIEFLQLSVLTKERATIQAKRLLTI